MYADLKMELDSPILTFQQSSNLQGVIMENIQTEYAERLHENRLNPYSQCLVKENGKLVWHIKTLTEEAYENIILPMAKLNELNIKKKQLLAPIKRKNVELYDESNLIKEFYDKKCERYLEVNFLTPTAFKRDGKYMIYPDLQLIYGSLMRKYSELSAELNMIDEDTLTELTEKSEIRRYRLQTVAFPLEKVQITGFVGSICIHMGGTDTLAKYARMLLKFGEFSGIGIKTGIGMGAIKYGRREKDE